MNKTVVVITGADSIAPAAAQRIPVDAVVIAADGALDHALAAGLVPAGLVGDMDSVSAAGLEWAARHATVERHDPDKDHTDTELALMMAADLQAGPPDPGRGRRPTRPRAGRDRRTRPATSHQHPGHRRLVGRAVDPRAPRTGHHDTRAHRGSTLSLLALHGPCTGVTITGVRWPLERADLAPLVGVGVSNVAVDEQVTIRVSTGVLTIVMPGQRTSEGDAS